MQMNPESFNGFLQGIGQDVEWRRAFACPCVNPASGSPKPRCPFCGGKGRTWSEPQTCRVGRTGGDVLKKWAAFGRADVGDTVLSLPSDSAAYAAGPYDRVLMLNATEPFSLNLVRGVNETMRMRVVSLDLVRYIDGDAMRELPLPVINADGVIQWGNEAPPAGVPYSITGRRHPEYFVFQEQPLDRPHHGGLDLPRRLVLRRFDLYGH